MTEQGRLTLPFGLFFTGTDTSVGKTFVMARVVRLLREQGHPVRVRKPVATGAVWTGNGWVSDDTRTLANAVDRGEDWRQITPWSFPDPVAPPVAARRQNVDLNLKAMAEVILEGVPNQTTLLVEGVGGLMCPLTERETVADLAAMLGLPMILVTRRSLGTLGLTLMAVEVARHRNLPLAGIVVSETTPCQTLAEETNVAELQARLKVPLLAVAHHQPGREPTPQPELEAVDWWRLSRGNP